MVGAGGASVSKTNGARVKGSLSRAANWFTFPAHPDLGQGFLRDLQLLWQDEETLTVNLSNTNVSEASMVGMDFTPTPHQYPSSLWEAAKMCGAKAIHAPQASITVGAAVTAYSGEVALTTATQETTGWLDKSKRYAILGIVPSLSTANGGFMQVRGLGGAWQGHIPAIPAPKLSAVTFSSQGRFQPAFEPIPFAGNEIPNVSLVGEAAAAHTFALVLAEL
jgi:hypothetical protein